MTKLIDISLPITPGMLTFPGNPAVELDAWQSLAAGAESSVSRLCLGTHTGTHVDPPAHVLPNGASVEQLPLEVLIGPARVLDLTGVESSIGPEDIEDHLRDGVERILLRTRNSELWRSAAAVFDPHYVSLSTEAARLLVDRGIRLVAVDGLSIESYKNPGRPTHRALLEAGIVVLEGVDLSRVPAGEYTLVCLPLRLRGADGSPARAVLIAQHD